MDYSGEPGPDEAQTDRLDAPGGQLLPHTFLKQLTRTVTLQGADQGLRLNIETHGRLAKFCTGRNQSIHYEVWVHDRTSQLEIGLHCESTPEYNALLYSGFDRAMIDIQVQLGQGFWLEQWDHGWIRLYETHPLRPLDAVRVEEIAARLLEIIRVVEPVYKAISAGLPEPPQPLPIRREEHGSWRR